MNPSVSDNYEGAIELLKEHGWVQNEWRATDGRMCLMEALLEAGLQDQEPVTLMSATTALRESGVELRYSSWNDKPGRTKEEVLDYLLEAAKALRNKGL